MISCNRYTFHNKNSIQFKVQVEFFAKTIITFLPHADVGLDFFIHKTFWELHSKTAMQHSSKQLKML